MLVVLAWLLGAAPGQARPRDLPSAVTAGCEVARQIASATRGVSIRRRVGTFSDERVAVPVRGCELRVSGSFARAGRGGAAIERLRDGFAARQWQPRPALDADGKDGTAFAFERQGVACLFRGEWDGGTDDEPPMPAGDRYRVTVVCTSPVPAELRAP